MLKKMKLAIAITLASTMVTSPAIAQEDTSSSQDAAAMASDLGLFKKLADAFAVDDAEPIAPEQLALAGVTTAAVLPEGTYGRLMERTFDQILSPMKALFGEISTFEVAEATGVGFEQLAALDEEQLAAIGQLLDPNRAERGERTIGLMLPLMKEAFTEIEPALREGMTRAYARKFSAEQLTEMNTFFKTPTGSFYASESFILMADPEIMRASMQAMPAIMNKVLSKIPDLEKGMEDVGRPRTLNDLNEEDIQKLADLLSVNAQQLKNHREYLNQPELEAQEGVEEEAADEEEVS